MEKFIAGLLFIFLCLPARAQYTFQPDEKYLRLSSHGMVLYQEQKYEPAALTYDSLFKHSKGKGLTIDFIVAGFSWAKAGNHDKAFAFLRKGLATYGIVNIDNFTTEPDLMNLHDDKRWQPLIEEVKARNKSIEAKLNKPMMAMLDSIHEIDQTDRQRLDSVQQKYGMRSVELGALWKKIMKQDSSNLIAVTHIINTYGWLGPEEVGERGATAIFLVIQHSDSLTQVTYLPVMRDAVKKGKAKPSNLALLEDRVLVKQGKQQIYGSQINSDSTGRNSFYPIMDEENVNKRRASVGLGPLEDYARFFGFDYQVPKPKKTKGR